MEKSFVLEIKSIKKCPGGYSCNLTANGKKVAYVAPDVFEWTSHRAMVDVLEFYGRKINLPGIGPAELEDGWMEKNAPSKKKLDMQDAAQRAIADWVRGYVIKYNKAKAIKDRCKETVLTVLQSGSIATIIDYYIHPCILKNPRYRKELQDRLIDSETILNLLSIDEIMEIV